MKGRQVALLRGINVGKAKRIAMADLRALVEKLGFRDVSTLLNSGNVVYTAASVTPAKAGARIEAAIVKRLGIRSRVTVITGRELEVAIRENPLARIAADPSRLMVAVPAGAAELKQLAALAKRKWGSERFALGERVAYLWCPEGILESPVCKAVADLLDDAVTSRNWATMNKLHRLVTGDSEA